jgi:hypothetical protein
VTEGEVIERSQGSGPANCYFLFYLAESITLFAPPLSEADLVPRQQQLLARVKEEFARECELHSNSAAQAARKRIEDVVAAEKALFLNSGNGECFSNLLSWGGGGGVGSNGRRFSSFMLCTAGENCLAVEVFDRMGPTLKSESLVVSTACESDRSTAAPDD